jgi:anti-anti-sigma factor
VSLAIEITPRSGGVVEISPRGEIDLDNAFEVREAIAGALSGSRPFRIELNLRAVTFIDSMGISALVAGFQTAEVSGVKLVVTQPSRFVHRQLWVTGLLGLFGAPAPYRPAANGVTEGDGTPVRSGPGGPVGGVGRR